ncbi:MAG: protein kinase [Pseudomonadota bacterium]
MNEDLTGQIIDGRYQVIERIAQGGMGVVYRVVHRYTGREEALKVIHKDLARDEDVRRRFLVEAMAVAKLKSPYTVTLYDCSATEDGQLHIAMEYLEGFSLRDALKNHGPMDWRRAVRFALHACLSLEEAHGKGILHRDIKPSNFLITRDEDGIEVLKVLDFGIARMDTVPGAAALTQAGEVLGTPVYMSPEQHRGERADNRSDIYSLGLVIHEMMTGRPPFFARSMAELKQMHLHDPASPVNTVRPSAAIPRKLQGILDRALAKDPDDRYQAVTEIRRDLEALAPELARNPQTRSVSGEADTLQAALDGIIADVPTQAALTQHKPAMDTVAAATRQALTELGSAKLVDSPRRAWWMVAGWFVIAAVIAAAGSSTLPYLAPARWLDLQAETLRQRIHLAPGGGRAVVVKTDLDLDEKTLRASGEPVPGAGVHTWRLLDARFLDRLSGAGASVVVFDKYYGRDYPTETAVLAAAIRRSVERGTRVVIGTLDRPPPPELVDAGAWFGSTYAVRSGFDGTINELLVRRTLADGNEIPSIFLRAYCLDREGNRRGVPDAEDVASCEARLQDPGGRWLLRYGAEAIRTIRVSDVLAWNTEDLADTVQGRVVFLGHFGPSTDEVLVPLIPSLEPTSAGTVHGVMLLASAFNQVDIRADWLRVGPMAAILIFALLAGFPLLILRRFRWPRGWLLSMVLVLVVAICGLVLPVSFPLGGALIAGLSTGVLFMIPSLRVRRRGLAIAAVIGRCLDMARGASPGGSLMPSRVSTETLHVLTGTVTDEASGLLYLKHLDALLNGMDAGGFLYRRVDGAFFRDNGWLRDTPANPGLPPGDLSLMTLAFPGAVARRLRDLHRAEEKTSREDLAVSSILLKSFSGRREHLTAVNWIALQDRLSRMVLDYARRLERWLEARRELI